MIPETPHDEKAQSGIGTLIILIAAILVATMAAGIFFDVAGLLSGQTQATSEDVSNQFEGQLEIVTVAGQISGDTVDLVNITVRLPSDNAAVDLRDATIQWVGPTDVRTYTWTGSGTDPSFDATILGGSGNKILDGGTERAILTIDPTESGAALNEGESVSITIITSAETAYRLHVPRSLPDRSSVEL
jgi:flagellin-like protein